MTKISLDTNAYSAFMAGDERIFNSLVDSELVYISAIVIGELFAGFYGGNRLKENREELKIFLSKEIVRILEVTVDTAEIFGELKSKLSRNGTMLPLNDIWIAAHAVETGSKLVTYDEHFKNISGLRLWDEI